MSLTPVLRASAETTGAAFSKPHKEVGGSAPASPLDLGEQDGGRVYVAPAAGKNFQRQLTRGHQLERRSLIPRRYRIAGIPFSQFLNQRARQGGARPKEQSSRP
jgi:hypothetical protein